MDESLFKNSIVTSERILYTPSPFARESLYHLQETGVLKANQPHSSKREHLSSCLFFIVTGGAGRLRYRGKTYELHTNDCVFINCEDSYSHETDTDLWSLRWIHFYGPKINEIYRKYTERGGTPVFTPDDPAMYIQLLSSIQSIASSQDYIKDMRINERITSLLTLCMDESRWPDTGSAAKKQGLAEVREYIDVHYAEKITLDDLSARFFINKFYLARIFHERFGMTLNAYLTQVRLNHAKELLRFSGLSLEEISVRCGLSNGAYLSRVFKKAEGIPPLSYRRQW